MVFRPTLATPQGPLQHILPDPPGISMRAIGGMIETGRQRLLRNNGSQLDRFRTNAADNRFQCMRITNSSAPYCHASDRRPTQDRKTTKHPTPERGPPTLPNRYPKCMVVLMHDVAVFAAERVWHRYNSSGQKGLWLGAQELLARRPGVRSRVVDHIIQETE